MVIPGHEPMGAADRIMADLLVQQLQLLLYGRSIGDAVTLLTAINAALADREAAEAEPTITVH